MLFSIHMPRQMTVDTAPQESAGGGKGERVNLKVTQFGPSGVAHQQFKHSGLKYLFLRKTENKALAGEVVSSLKTDPEYEDLSFPLSSSCSIFLCCLGGKEARASQEYAVGMPQIYLPAKFKRIEGKLKEYAGHGQSPAEIQAANKSGDLSSHKCGCCSLMTCWPVDLQERRLSPSADP